MSVDTLRNSLSVIKTSYTRHRIFCEVKKSSFMLRFLKVLRQNNLIYGFVVSGSTIVVYLRYFRGLPAISYLRQESRPGSRVYVNTKVLKTRLKTNPSTVYIMSTPNGVTSQLNHASTGARKKHCGELICTI